MAKKGKEQQKQVASKHVTTRRLARWQQEKRRQRITFLSGIVIIVIVLGIIVGGVMATRTSDWLSKVQTDSGTITIKKADYANGLKLFQVGIRVGIYNASTMTNESPLNMLENNYLFKDKTEEVGVTVSKTEIDNILLAIFGMANKSISDTDFQQAYQNALGNLSISDKEFRDIIEGPLLDQNLTNYFINQSPESGPQANISIFTVSNISMAIELAQKWRNGEEITALSAEYGIDGQSVWLPKGYVGGGFDTVAFTIEVGNVSDPIPVENISDATSSSDEYYVIKVLERKDDVISDSMRQVWGSKEYNTWYLQARQGKVERNPKLDLSEVYAWAVKQLS